MGNKSLIPRRGFTLELDLLVGCCRSAFAAANAAEIPLLAKADWGRFVALARFHRVQGLVWDRLSNVADLIPKDAAALLEGDAKAIAIANLRAAAESRLLRDAFDAAKMPLLFLKGLTLGTLAYRNPSAKTSIDIDLLIDPADLAEASELLTALGYRLALPDGLKGIADLRRWHRQSKESAWIKDVSSIEIDLHTGLADSSRLIPAIDVHSPRQAVQVGGGIALPTLAMDELFSYLAVHGAWSSWFRLKWLSDLAALLHSRSADEIEHLYRRSQELGAGHAAGQSLLLADALFGTLRALPRLREHLSADRSTRWLYRHGLRSLTSNAGEPTERRFGTVPIHRAHFALLSGPSAKWTELRRKMRWLAFRATR
jgi:hypothetical protein